MARARAARERSCEEFCMKMSSLDGCVRLCACVHPEGLLHNVTKCRNQCIGWAVMVTVVVSDGVCSPLCS
jgi:hypothetical protein